MLFIQTVLLLTGDLFLFKILKNNNLENYALIILFFFSSFIFLIPANLKLADNRYKNYTIYVNLPLIIKLSVSAIVLFFKKLTVFSLLLINFYQLGSYN